MSLYSDVAFSRTTKLGQAELNRRMKILADAIETLRLFAPDWQEQVEALRAVALERINQALLPAYDAILGLAQLGALFSASSSSAISVGTGSRLFTIAESQRIIFAPAANLAITLDDDPTIVLYGRLAGYDRDNGTLDVNIDQAIGAGTHAGWTISASPPRALTHELRADNPHAVTAAQVGTLTAEEIDEYLDILRGSIVGDASAAMDTLAKVEAEIGEVNAALALRLRADVVQLFSEGERALLRANAGVGVVAGFRNKIINGDFDIWQRGASFTTSGYTADRWALGLGTGAAGNVSKQDGAVAHGRQMAYARFARTTLGSSHSRLSQKIEGVGTLAGKTVTVSFWARSSLATEIRTILAQSFGTGGSPSADVVGAAATHSLTAEWQRFNRVVTLADIAGKTRGSNGDDYLQLRFDWLTTAPNPLTNVDIAHVSIVEGDASTEADPLSPRHIQQELALCQRYFHRIDTWYGGFGVRYANAAASTWDAGIAPFPVIMRAIPTAAILSAPAYQNCSDAAWSCRSDMAVLRVTTAAAGGYRAYAGVHSFDAEL